jgi:enoyl-CoA hydratase/carnithine racemase
MAEFETILYEERGAVAWVTLNRPEVLHAFNLKMQEELAKVWHDTMRNGDVRCVVVTASGDRAFCVGIDRSETIEGDEIANGTKPGYITPWWYADPGRRGDRRRRPRVLHRHRPLRRQATHLRARALAA